MDYSQLHDAQINMMVCKTLGLELSSYARIIKQDDATILLSDNKTLVDYCNNPADAWPIIVENRIRINPVLYTMWMAEDYLEDVSHTYTNPLRAAMIVFLLMKDSE